MKWTNQALTTCEMLKNCFFFFVFFFYALSSLAGVLIMVVLLEILFASRQVDGLSSALAAAAYMHIYPFGFLLGKHTCCLATSLSLSLSLSLPRMPCCKNCTFFIFLSFSFFFSFIVFFFFFFLIKLLFSG